MTDEIPTKIIVDCKTGKQEILPLTAEEIAEREAMAAQAEADRLAREAQEAERLATKQAAIAKLTALGLTEAEALAIVGA